MLFLDQKVLFLSQIAPCASQGGLTEESISQTISGFLSSFMGLSEEVRRAIGHHLGVKELALLSIEDKVCAKIASKRGESTKYKYLSRTTMA